MDEISDLGGAASRRLIHGEVGAKRLELLREVVPTAAVIAVLFNPSGPNAASDMREVDRATRALGLKALPLAASSERDIDAVRPWSTDAVHSSSTLTRILPAGAIKSLR